MGTVLREICQLASVSVAPLSPLRLSHQGGQGSSPPDVSICVETSQYHLLPRAEKLSMSRLIQGPEASLQGRFPWMRSPMPLDSASHFPSSSDHALLRLLDPRIESSVLYSTPDLRIRLMSAELRPWNLEASLYLDGPWGYPHTFASLVIEF